MHFWQHMHLFALHSCEAALVGCLLERLVPSCALSVFDLYMGWLPTRSTEVMLSLSVDLKWCLYMTQTTNWKKKKTAVRAEAVCMHQWCKARVSLPNSCIALVQSCSTQSFLTVIASLSTLLHFCKMEQCIVAHYVVICRDRPGHFI